MSGQAAELARELARRAEAVCRHYLSNGRRSGRYWVVGDVHNSPGRSLYVRLAGPTWGRGAAGHFTDAATGEHGDLLDLIAANCGFARLRDACMEARTFLSLPLPDLPETTLGAPAPRGSEQAARRLFRAGVPIVGTRAEAYLRARGITGSLDWPSLRYHPALWYRAHPGAPRETWPGLLAAVTDNLGRITGVHRTFLDRRRPEKAPLPEPRRALGHLLGNGVRFDRATKVLLAGEGIETVLSLKSALPHIPMIAALSANHLAVLDFPPSLRRLYIAHDRDAAGCTAARRLHERSRMTDIEVRDLVPEWSDFNEDLRRLHHDILRARLSPQLKPGDHA